MQRNFNFEMKAMEKAMTDEFEGLNCKSISKQPSGTAERQGEINSLWEEIGRNNEILEKICKDCICVYVSSVLGASR